nr:putative steroidogenic factor 1 [Solemya velum]
MLNGSTMGTDSQFSADVKVGFEELCPVCGDKVSGYHYGLLTCESCKGFFKRTVQNKKVYSCVDNRSCHIDKSQRKRCPYCRFQKCLSVGMKLEAVREDRMRGGRNKFGPMYKRDRAIKQQAFRQTAMLQPCQMRMVNGMADHGQEEMDIKPDQATLLAISQNIGYGINQATIAQMNHSPVITTSVQNSIMTETSASDLSRVTMVTSHQARQAPSPITTSTVITQGHYNTVPQNYTNTITSLHNNYSLQVTPLTHPSLTHSQPPPPPPPPVVVPALISELKASMADENDIKHKLLTFLQTEFGQEDLLSHPQKLLQLVCKLADQLLFLMVEWARTSIFFKEMKVEDQMKLLQNCWSEVLILDFVQRMVMNSWSTEVHLSNGQKMSLDCLDKLGLGDLKDRVLELVRKMRELKIDVNEYICLKFLILLNPDVLDLEHRQYVKQCQEKINAVLMDYSLNDRLGQLLVRLPELQVISSRAEEFFYVKHLSGEIPNQTLLMEMLHSKRK